VAVRLRLPLAEVWEELQAQVWQLAEKSGRKIRHGILGKAVVSG